MFLMYSKQLLLVYCHHSALGCTDSSNRFIARFETPMQIWHTLDTLYNLSLYPVYMDIHKTFVYMYRGAASNTYSLFG